MAADDVDEVALNVMLAEGVDPATAVVASVQYVSRSGATRLFAVIVALISGGLAYWLLRGL